VPVILRRTLAEIGDLHAETNRLRAETNALRAESSNLRADIRAQNERGDALMAEIRDEVARSRAQHEGGNGRLPHRGSDHARGIRRNELAFRQGGELLAELAEEVRAQTRAIFEVLDRLNGGTAAA